MTTRTLDAEVAFPAQCELAEGPLWDASRGLLRWVDILPGQVHALDVTSGAHRTTAREGFTAADLAAEPHAGDIFACTPGVSGRPPFLFGH
jgi:sugar lactone lactonase YvrE